MLSEPPGADPHAGWCGRGQGEPGLYPIRCSAEAGTGGQLYAVVCEGDVADDGMMEVLGAGVVNANVVGCPTGAELVALGRELADDDS
jgi:hypothetical protein